MTQLDLFRDHPRDNLDRIRDRGRVWQAYTACLSLEDALKLDIPADEVREVWPDHCPCVPDSSLDRRRVMEAVQEMGAEGALDYYLPDCSDPAWLRATVAEFAR